MKVIVSIPRKRAYVPAISRQMLDCVPKSLLYSQPHVKIDISDVRETPSANNGAGDMEFGAFNG